MADHEVPAAARKWKRGMKSMSVTPSINGDEEDRDLVRGRVCCL